MALPPPGTSPSRPGGGAVALAALLWLVGVEPLVEKADALERRVSKQEMNLQWMQKTSAEIIRLRGQDAANLAPPRSGSLLTMVDRSAKKTGISQAVKRIEPTSDGGVQVWLEGATFDNLLLWLGDLRGKGADATSISIERQQTAGRVNAKATLGWL